MAISYAFRKKILNKTNGYKSKRRHLLKKGRRCFLKEQSYIKENKYGPAKYVLAARQYSWSATSYLYNYSLES